MGDPELIVVGGGIGGAAAALRASQYHLQTVWVTGDRATNRASRVAYVYNVDNMIGVHPGIVQKQLADKFRKSLPEIAMKIEEPHLHISTRDIVDNVRDRIEREYSDKVRILDDRAVTLTAGSEQAEAAGGFRLRVGGGETLSAPNIVLATGVMDRQPVIHKEHRGRDASGIHWIFPYANHETLLYCIRCEGHLTPGRRVVVIGGGDGAAEVSLMVRERYDSQVAILTAGEPVTWSERRARLLRSEDVEVHNGKIIDVDGVAKEASLRGFVLESGKRIEADLAFVAMGIHRVYNDLAVSLGAELEKSDAPPEQRHVLVDLNGETTVPGMFAVGDMARRHDEVLMKQIYTAQEYAVRAVDTIDRRRRREYRVNLLKEE